MTRMRPIDRQAMVLVIAVLVADQASKQFLLGYLTKAATPVVPVIDGFFRLVKVWNSGVSFGLLGGDGAKHQADRHVRTGDIDDWEASYAYAQDDVHPDNFKDSDMYSCD